MAGELQERMRDTKRNTSGAELGPGKKRSPVPPTSVLAISGLLCQHRPAFCSLPLGSRPQIQEIK